LIDQATRRPEEAVKVPSTEELDANKKVARAYVEQVFNQHRPEKAADFVTDDVVWHGGGLGEIAGVERLTGLLESFIGALPGLYAVEQDIVAEDDLVVVRLVVGATVNGTQLGVPADVKLVRWDAVDTYRITDGKISEEWTADDVASIMIRSTPSPRLVDAVGGTSFQAHRAGLERIVQAGAQPIS
jgi:predicted ester cyclase